MVAKSCTFGMLVAASAFGAAALSDGMAGRYEYRVVGVRSSDNLNMRERVESEDTISDAKIVGRIPPAATGLLGTGATRRVGRNRWFEVRYGNVRGWVNGRFLAPVSRSLDRELEAGLFCSGTEPFWSLKTDDLTAEVSRPGTPVQHYSVAAREPFQGRKDALALRLVSDSDPEVSALVQHKEWCSDGMSDLEYAFEVRIIGLDGHQQPLKGCCSVLP